MNEELLHAFDCNSGRKLWEAVIEGSVYGASKYSLFVIDDLVWTGDVAGGGANKRNPYTGRDLKAGEVTRRFYRDVDHVGYHSRCYPNKATVKYLMPNIRGVEMVDLEKETWSADNWVRPGCSFGLMPSHGMIYTPPHACMCYAQSKLFGFNALYGDAMGASKVVADPNRQRLEKGTGPTVANVESSPTEWPTYRGNNLRTGSSTTRLDSRLKEAWSVKLGGKLSAVTVAHGRVFVAQIDEHTLHAVAAADGKELWSVTVGGRIDSPPTLYKGKAYFGCADGYLYCLNASDGKMAWRFLAAADDKRLMSYGQLESVHPLHGSVLIQDGIVYCLAGRSMFLDGGLRLYRLDADTGEELSANVMDHINPFTEKSLMEKTVRQSMPPSMPDILSSDGKLIYMGAQPLDLMGKRVKVETHLEEATLARVFELHQGDGRHIFSFTGLLDDARFHRSRWIYGKLIFGGHRDQSLAGRVAPTGSMLVCDDENVCGYHAGIAHGNGWLSNSIFSVRKDASPGMSLEGIKPDDPAKEQVKIEHNWIVKTKCHVNALLLAGNHLFVATSTADNKEHFLKVHSASSGELLEEYPLPAMVVWDGMALSEKKLYIALKNGTVACKQ